MKKRIIFVGKSAVGKDYMKNLYKSLGMKADVSYTTRPCRPGEQNGIDYNFISESEFELMITDKKFYEYTWFNGFYYGTSKDSWENNKIFIMDPKGVNSIHENDRKESTVILILADRKIIVDRLKTRGWDDDKINNRLSFDQNVFKDFENFDMVLVNNGK